MPTLHKLSALQVQNAKPGKYNDGGGLWFIRRKDGGGQWILRLTMHGRRRDAYCVSVAVHRLRMHRQTAPADSVECIREAGAVEPTGRRPRA